MVGALVAVGKRVGVGVVEQRVVSITPREFLQADGADNDQEKVASLAAWVRAGLTLVRIRRCG